MYIYMYVYTFIHIHIDIYNSLETWTFTFKVYLKLGHSVSCLCTHQQVIHIKVTYWMNEWNGGRDNLIKTGEGVKIHIDINIPIEITYFLAPSPKSMYIVYLAI